MHLHNLNSAGNLEVYTPFQRNFCESLSIQNSLILATDYQNTLNNFTIYEHQKQHLEAWLENFSLSDL